MIIQIISTLIALIIYNTIKKLIKFIFIKKNKNNLQTILNTMVEKQDMNKFFDKDFWGE